MSKKTSITSLGNIETLMDWGHLREFVSNDSDLEIEILAIFFDNVPDYINDLKTCDIMHWSAACHKLKGSARAIGAWAFAHQSELAELSNPPAKDSDARKSIINLLQKDLMNLRKEIFSQHDVFKA